MTRLRSRRVWWIGAALSGCGGSGGDGGDSTGAGPTESSSASLGDATVDPTAADTTAAAEGPSTTDGGTSDTTGGSCRPGEVTVLGAGLTADPLDGLVGWAVATTTTGGASRRALASFTYGAGLALREVDGQGLGVGAATTWPMGTSLALELAGSEQGFGVVGQGVPPFFAWADHGGVEAGPFPAGVAQTVVLGTSNVALDDTHAAFVTYSAPDISYEARTMQFTRLEASSGASSTTTEVLVDDVSDTTGEEIMEVRLVATPSGYAMAWTDGLLRTSALSIDGTLAPDATNVASDEFPLDLFATAAGELVLASVQFGGEGGIVRRIDADGLVAFESPLTSVTTEATARLTNLTRVGEQWMATYTTSPADGGVELHGALLQDDLTTTGVSFPIATGLGSIAGVRVLADDLGILVVWRDLEVTSPNEPLRATVVCVE